MPQLGRKYTCSSLCVLDGTAVNKWQAVTGLLRCGSPLKLASLCKKNTHPFTGIDEPVFVWNYSCHRIANLKMILHTKIAINQCSATATKLNVLFSIIILFTPGAAPGALSLPLSLTSLSCSLVQLAIIQFNLMTGIGRQFLSDYFATVWLTYLIFEALAKPPLRSSILLLILHTLGVVMPCVWH